MAHIEVYVDTDTGTSGGDGTTGNPYDSLATAQSQQVGDLTAAGDHLTIYCRGSAADTADVHFTGWTTSATSYIVVKPDTGQEHNGVWNTGIYRLVVNGGAAGACVNLEDCNYIRFEGLQLQQTLTPSVDPVNCFFLNPNNVSPVDWRISNCLLRGPASDLSLVRLIEDGSSNHFTGSKVYILSNILYDIGNYDLAASSNLTDMSTGIYANSVDERTIYIAHNTVYGSYAGIGALSGTSNKPVLTNNLVQNSGGDCYKGSFDTASDYNVADDATAPGTHSLNSTTAFFVSAGSDLHLASSGNSSLITLNNIYNTASWPSTTAYVDVDGEARSLIYVGADELTNAGIPAIMKAQDY